jgi:ABC-type glycerol-3-phosphate transport system substrate-binding protein
VTELEWDEAARRFGAGEFAMILGGSYELSFILEASGWDDAARRRRLGFVPVPAGPRGAPAATAGGMAYGIFRQTAAPAAALAVIKRLAASDLLAAFNRATGQVPPRRSIIERLDPDADSFLVETARIARDAQIRPPIPEYARVSAQLQRMVADVLAGRRTPGEAVARTAELIAAITGLPIAR